MKDQIKPELAPIIIIGAARSGTKFLRDTLSQDASFKCVPYDINYIWRIGNEHVPFDELDPANITPKMRRDIITQIYKIAGIELHSANIRLIEKSVSNGLRVEFIEEIFPNAIYVHLVRDGRATIESAMRLWQAPADTGSLMRKLKDLPLSRYGYVFWFALNYFGGKIRGRSGGKVWGPRYKGIHQDVENEDLLTVVSRQWNETVLKASNSLAKIDASRVFEIRYEDLVSSEEKLRDLAVFVGASDPQQILDVYKKTLQVGNTQKWRQTLDAKSIAKIEKHAKVALKRFGYL